MSDDHTVSRLNAYEGDNIWQDLILREFDLNWAAIRELDPSDSSDRIVLADGTIIHYDGASQQWHEAGTYDGYASDDAMLVEYEDRPDQQRTRSVLAAGLAWLYNTVQPDNAIQIHHGFSCVASDRLSVSFAPLSNPVVVIDIRDARRDDTQDDRPLLNPLTRAECDDIAVLLTELGHRPVGQWNGAGCETGSFQLAGPIHPTLKAACSRYHAGCPDHGSVFCGCKEGCTWYSDGSRLVVPPTWPDLATAA